VIDDNVPEYKHNAPVRAVLNVVLLPRSAREFLHDRDFWHGRPDGSAVAFIAPALASVLRQSVLRLGMTITLKTFTMPVLCGELTSGS
jgi:hypothetical protein